MTRDAEERMSTAVAYFDRAIHADADPRKVIEHAIGHAGLAAEDFRAVLQALADTRDENDRLFVEAATEKTQRELFQGALAEVQAERDRLRTELADTRQQLDEARRRMRATSQAVEQRARIEDTTGIASAYCAWWDASALVDETLGLTDDPQPDPGPTRHGHDSPSACGPTPNQPTGAPDV